MTFVKQGESYRASNSGTVMWFLGYNLPIEGSYMCNTKLVLRYNVVWPAKLE
jgi:hypothetical protein